MVVQHDNAFVRAVDLRPVLRALKDPRVSYVGLLSSATLDYATFLRSRFGITVEPLADLPLLPLASDDLPPHPRPAPLHKSDRGKAGGNRRVRHHLVAQQCRGLLSTAKHFYCRSKAFAPASN